MVTDDANFYPDPISNQDVFEVVTNPQGYIVNKPLPNKQSILVHKSSFDFGLYNYIGNQLLQLSELNVEPTFLQPNYSLKDSIIECIDGVYTTIMQNNQPVSHEQIKKFLPQFQEFIQSNKNVFINLVTQPARGRGGGGGPPDDDPEDDDQPIGKSGPPDKLNNDKSYASTEEGQWYIIKTIIYWLLKNIRPYYELTSTHMKHLFSICYDLAISIYTNIIGSHPYIFTTVSAVALLRPDLIPQVFDTLVFFVSSMTTIIQNVFSFFSSTGGLVILGVGAAVLLYNLSKSINKVSLY
jgi:hypothetical protein